ncbi:MAG: RbsD/FucU family protein [Planctomycetales bacterium]
MAKTKCRPDQDINHGQPEQSIAGHLIKRAIQWYKSKSTLSIHPFLSRGLVMLLHQLIHPKINEVLGRAGHHGKVLIADGNYPASSTLGPNAELVSLNLSPGIVTVAQVLQTLAVTIPIEAANTMMYETTGPYALEEDPPAWTEFRAIFRAAKIGVDLEPIDKWDFYPAVNTPDHVLTIQTADQQRFANLLLTIGVRMD